MGLLSNQKLRDKVKIFIEKYSSLFSIISYFIGVVWLLLLAYEPLNAKVYFSENSLLPGLVTTERHRRSDINILSESLEKEIKRLNKDINTKYSIPKEFLLDYFRGEGLEVFTQNFTFSYPSNIRKGQWFPGSNVYAVLRAYRTASTEALVYSAPYLPTDDKHDGIAMLMYLARKFKRHNYWAKDIVFLIPEHNMIGASAYLNSYHYVHNEYIKGAELHARSGSIQAAVNLELSSLHNLLNIKVEGINGQLPNLDLINTAVRLAEMNGIEVTLQHQTDHYRPESSEGYLRGLTAMVSMIHSLASGQPMGCHGAFLSFNIEAITLQSFQHSIKSGRSIGLDKIAGMLDSMSRSLNNLMERFHQSFFFYLMSSSHRYISIGLYMPPVVLIAVVPLVLQAISLWIKITKNENKTNLYEDAFSLLPHLILVSLFAGTAYMSINYFIELALVLHLSPGAGLLLGATCLQFTGFVAPVVFIGKFEDLKKKGLYIPNDTLMKFFCLIFTALVFGGLACLNVSLCIVLSLFWTPVLLLIRKSTYRIVNLLMYILILIVSPLSISACYHFLPSYLAALMSITPTDLGRAPVSADAAMVSSFVDSAHFGVWTLPLASFVMFPLWTMCCMVLMI